MNHNNSLFLTAVALSLSLTACIDVPEEKHTSYETLDIKTQDIEFPMRFSATLEGQKEVTITPQTSGNVTAVLVQIGSRVHKGQAMFQIDPRQAQAAVDNAAANVQAAKASMNTAKLEMESNKNLFDKGIVSSYMYETAKNAYNQAVSAVAQAEAALKNARLELSYCTVTSPINGIVGSRSAELGELMTPGIPMATVSESATIKAKFSMSESEFIAIKKEHPDANVEKALTEMPDVKLELKDGSEYQHKGRIRRISGVINTETGAVDIEAEFPNPENRLNSGNMGTVILPVPMKDVILIPATAIVRQLDKTVVWMVGADSCAHSNVVEIYDLGKQVGIISGLKSGDKIVSNGASNVTDGEKVIFEGVKSEK